jgi:peptidyl-prolyl cis-trans isomerase D
MLKALRENTKTILWITIAAFVALIFLAWGMDIQSGRGPTPGTVAKVNGYTITRSELQDAERNTLQSYQKQYDRTPTDAEAEAMREQAWNSLVQRILLSQEAARRGLGATNEEVVYSIRMDPPPFVQYLQAFQTDGKFDPQKYRAGLQDPLLDWTSLEAWVRSTLPMTKLQDLVSWGAKVSQPELKMAYESANEKRTISYVLVDPSKEQIDEGAITEKQARDYYAKNKERFTEPEQAKVGYLFLELKPSASDSAEVLADLQKILADIRNGEDFEETARIHSEDPTADQGGNPGRPFKRNELTKSMADVLFSMQKGDVSEPFLDQRGYHIVKLVDKSTVDGEEEVDFRNILKTVEPGQATVDLTWERVQNLEKAVAGGMSLSQAAQGEGLKITETPYFKRGAYVPGLAGLPNATETAFSMAVGTVKGPLTTYRGHYFIELEDKKESRLKSFEEVRDECFTMLKDELRADMAYKKAEAMAQTVSSGQTLEQVAQAESLEVKSAGPFNMSGYVVGVGREPALVGAAFSGTVGGPALAAKGQRGSYVIRVDEIQKPDPEGFEKQKASLADNLLMQKQSRAYTEWMQRLKDKADIKDYREGY